MPRGQRLGFLAVAAVIAIVAAIALGASGGDEGEPAGAGVGAPADPTPAADRREDDAEATPEPTPEPEPRPPLLRAGREQTLRVKQGERVRFRVRHDTPEHVHVHGYDIFQDLEPGKTATVSFRADITGIFEIELEDSHQLLAHLRVEP